MDENATQKYDSFLRDLRNQTAESHKSLENRQLSRSLLEQSLSISFYQLYLSRLYGVVRACEAQAYPLLSHLLADLPRREKAELIFNDLLATGMSQNDIAQLPVHHFHEMTIAQAIGVMYVLEGSTLGGKILYKHISQSLALNEQTGVSYFYGYGQQTGILWKSFITTMADYAVEENCEQEIISSAVSTFNEIGRWLNETEIN